MAIKPILFNTEMVKAILEGRKMVTRRPVKPQPDSKHQSPLGYVVGGCKQDNEGYFGWGIDEYGGHIQYAKPPYNYGDILYVRETWQHAYSLDNNDKIIDGTGKYYYAAGPEDALPNFTHWLDENTGEYKDYMPWKPSIHMPKEAARIFLRITDVRVEKLQDITTEECHKEGVLVAGANNVGTHYNPVKYDFSVEKFETLWDSTIKKSDIDNYGWNANPYVWVIEFERCEKPEELEER